MLTFNHTFRNLALAGTTALLTGLAGGAAWAQATDLVCVECVQATDIAPNAVNNSKIGNGAVNAPKLAAQRGHGGQDRQQLDHHGEAHDGCCYSSKDRPERREFL